jgi:hypothetical protein
MQLLAVRYAKGLAMKRLGAYTTVMLKENAKERDMTLDCLICLALLATLFLYSPANAQKGPTPKEYVAYVGGTIVPPGKFEVEGAQSHAVRGHIGQELERCHCRLPAIRDYQPRTFCEAVTDPQAMGFQRRMRLRPLWT